jgi:dihydropteroate synthase
MLTINNNSKALTMGILNVTPDSFNDGGMYIQHDKALEHALDMIEQGADIIDVGGESSRPGALPVSLDEECSRVIPIIEKIRQHSDVPISIDTVKPDVMELAVNAGATMINDIKALTEKGAIEMAAKLAVPVCLMHMQGNPSTMQDNPFYAGDIIDELNQFFAQRIKLCLEAGIEKSNLIIDPGFGFGKTVENNLTLCARLNEINMHDCPILLGVSRKSSIGVLLDQPVEERLVGSLTLAVCGVNNGANIIRAHDVKETVQALTMAWEVSKYKSRKV